MDLGNIGDLGMNNFSSISPPILKSGLNNTPSYNNYSANSNNLKLN